MVKNDGRKLLLSDFERDQRMAMNSLAHGLARELDVEYWPGRAESPARVIRDRQAANHHRIAVFCQSVAQLKILFVYLYATDVGEVFLYDSSLSARQRNEMVKDFLACDKGVLVHEPAQPIDPNFGDKLVYTPAAPFPHRSAARFVSRTCPSTTLPART